MTEELKPCPWCGSHQSEQVGRYIQCGSNFDVCDASLMRIDIRDWQNAHCWKLLEEKDARIRELENVLECDAAGRPIPELLRIAAENTDALGGGAVSDCLHILADSIEALSLPVAKSDYAILQARTRELENQIHRARTLWCDSKREPETGAVNIEYLDQFEAAISPKEPDL